MPDPDPEESLSRSFPESAMHPKDDLHKFTRLAKVLILALLSARGLNAHAQATATATQRLQLSTFGGVTGTYTGLGGGRNLGITAGVDLGIRAYHSFNPSLEIRGTYPIAKGRVDSQRNVLGGLKVSRTFGRFRPYADILFGRGQINYNPGFVNPSRTLYYVQSVSNVFSPGIGVDVDLTDRFSFKADAQLQHYSLPVTTAGHIYAKAGTLALVYHFDFNHRLRDRKDKNQPAPIVPQPQ